MGSFLEAASFISAMERMAVPESETGIGTGAPPAILMILVIPYADANVVVLSGLIGYLGVLVISTHVLPNLNDA